MTNGKLKERKQECVAGIGAFVVPVLILALIYFEKGIYPGSAVTVLVYDQQAQFAPLFASLRYIGEGDNSFFYSHFGALGWNTLGNTAYYLGNPISFLSVLFPLKYLSDFLYFLTLLKIGLCGLAFSVWLRKGNREDSPCLFMVVLFSSCYALSSYNLLYSMCLMWLDAVWLLPLLLLGIEEIRRGKKGILFCFALSFCLICNYYMAFSCAIFCVLWTIFRSICDWENVRGTFGNMVRKLFVNGFLAVGLSAPILFPAIADMIGGKLSEDNTAFYSDILRCTLFEALQKLLPQQYDTIGDGGLPSLYCGTVALLALFVFFICKEVTPRTRMAAGGFLIVLFASFCIAPLDRVWHGFRDPNSFPCRYAFTFVCFVLTLGYQGFCKISLFSSDNRRRSRSFIMSILGIYTVMELFLNGSYLTSCLNVESHYETRATFSNADHIMRGFLDEIRMDSDFYRISKNFRYSYNDGAMWGYNGIAYFTSSYNLSLTNLFGALGYCQSYNVLQENGATPVAESLFGVRYRLELHRQEDMSLYEPLLTQGNGTLYQNPLALSVGFAVDSGASNVEGAIGADPFFNQNMILGELLGEKVELYSPIEYVLSDVSGTPKADPTSIRSVEISFTAPSDAPVWICFGYAGKAEKQKQKELAEIATDYNDYGIPSAGVESLVVNGESIGRFQYGNNTFCVFLGTFEAGETVDVVAESADYYYDPFIVTLDVEKYNDVFRMLASGEYEISSHGKAAFSGKVLIEPEESLLLTLPFADGYRILVDGKKREYTSYRGAFILVPMDSGEHTVEISYRSPGFMSGGVVACVSAIFCAFYFVGIKERKLQA